MKSPLKIAHIKKRNYPEHIEEFGRMLMAKWEKRDYEKAKKEYEQSLNKKPRKMTTDTIYTDHVVDNYPSPADEAYLAFRKHFPLVRCYVEKDATWMEYKMDTDEAAAEKWLKKAELIIKEKGLPLDAYLKTWKRGGVVFGIQLFITYINR